MGILLLLSGCGQEDPLLESPTESVTGSSLLIEPVTVEASVPTGTIPNITVIETYPGATVAISDSVDSEVSSSESRSVTTDTETETTEYFPEFETDPPVITKHPTDETVTEGGKALFVAHADKAAGITWWLIPNNGDEAISAFDTSRIPGLIVTNPLSDTLTLDFIPLNMNGWHVKAEFYNPAGFTSTESALLTVCEKELEHLPSSDFSDIPDIYIPVIENCRYVKNHFDEYGFGNEESEESRNEYFKNDIYELGKGADLLQYDLGYTLIDLDGDGIEELIIGCHNPEDNNDYFNDIIFALFTINEGEPVKVLQSWVRNRHYLCPDNLIRCEGSSGASNNDIGIYAFAGNSLKAVEYLWTEDYEGDGNVEFHYSHEGWAYEDDTSKIAYEQYEEILNRLENTPIVKLPGLASIS